MGIIRLQINFSLFTGKVFFLARQERITFQQRSEFDVAGNMRNEGYVQKEIFPGIPTAAEKRIYFFGDREAWSHDLASENVRLCRLCFRLKFGRPSFR